MNIKSIALIGAGKVATHLALELKRLQFSINCVWSRTEKSARKLGEQLGSHWTTSFDDIPYANLFIILVKDDAIAMVAKELSDSISPQALVAHSSGAVPSSILSTYFSRYGVFYPLQTFSEGLKPDFSKIPICVYSNTNRDNKLLENLGRKISENVHLINDEQRGYLHLTAVFVNNFTNHLQHISSSILEEQQLPHTLLQPLLEETVRKLGSLTPKEAQTGPAIRGDQQTIDKHLQLLADNEQWQEIYRVLSRSIGNKDFHLK